MYPPIITQSLPSGLSFDLILVEGGEFDMGGADAEAVDREKPIHHVKVPSFYLGRFQVTQDLWEEVMGNNPSRFYKEPRHPVESMSWEEVQLFIQRLNENTSGGYRLPTEAEWEYAARGGKYSEGYKYAGSDKLKEVGWYKDNSGEETHEVGLLRENELGLFDMSGNVWEWCQDQWHDNYKGAPNDGSAWLGLKQWPYRVLRGGGWIGSAGNCRAVRRFRGGQAYRINDVGFRLVQSPSQLDRPDRLL